MADDWYIETTRGAYGHHASIDREADTCDACRQPRSCLTIDTSEDEYARLSVCKDCMIAAFAGTLVLVAK